MNIVTRLEKSGLIKVLITVTAMLIVLNVINDIIGQPSHHITRLIDVDLESNITTWFSSLIWILAAYMAYKCYRLSTAVGLNNEIWILFCFLFLIISCDEVAMIHENLGRFLNIHFFKLELNTVIIIFLPILAPFMIFFIFLIGKELKKSKIAARLILLGFSLFLIGSIGIEQRNNFEFFIERPLLIRIGSMFEEGLEMLGGIVIIMGLKAHRRFLLANLLLDKKEKAKIEQ